MAQSYGLMEIARIGALFLSGDWIEEALPPKYRAYPNGDELDFEEIPYNAVKRTLLLTERIDPSSGAIAAVWVRRPDDPDKGEVLVAGKALPIEGPDIIVLGAEIRRAFSGLPTRRKRPVGESVYVPVRNSEDDIVGVLEVSTLRETYFI
ncbi:hypothetical protein [Paenibacillus flagellatus]|uniref:Uncharacterized protein n=1 Tax=Paenibacillus flagellatus TaxID=2211139 RepID=A0A2V5K7M1_9BACL|nr:hypothetical protein [Paenibacillus flagellatus]PYI54812.1 hypothetical protein DLM86_09665 [Paenibacillus flagellatus]